MRVQGREEEKELIGFTNRELMRYQILEGGGMKEIGFKSIFGFILNSS